MPRLAGAIPKLRPKATLPAITTSRPTAEISAVYASGTSAVTFPDRTNGGPASDSVVITAAATERSTMFVRRRTIVSTTTSDSLARSSRPVTWPVRRKSPSTFTENSANSAPTNVRAARSRTTSEANHLSRVEAALNAASKPLDGSCATLGNMVHLGLVDEVRRARPVEQLARNRRLNAAIPAERRHLIEEVARMTRPERAVRRPVMAPVEVRHHHLVELELPAEAVQLEDPGKLVERRIPDGNLVRNSP